MMPELLRVVPLKLHVRSATQPDGAAPMYELFCRWRNETLKPDDSFTYTEWSVWRTYDAFQALDTELRAQKHCKFAKMMVTVAFAPEHRVRMFFHQDQTARFLEKRQKELDYYMQRILLFSGVSEFVAGTGSRVLAAFLDADQHLDCSRLLDRTSVSSVLSPTSLLLEQHSREALRTLNVDMHAAFSPASSCASSSATSRSFDHKRSSSTSGSGASANVSARKAVKQEIEDEVALRGGEHALKRFRKRARAFRKENDPSVAAQSFVTYVAHDFDTDFSAWLVQKFIVTVKQAEKTAALRAAGRDVRLALPDHDDDDDADADAASRKARRAKLQMQRTGMSSSLNPAATTTKLSRKQSSKEIMARVHKYARGNDEHIESFKVAAKALGSQEMTAAQFVAFVRATFGRSDAHEILYLVADVVPLPHVQRELRDVLAI